MTASLLTCALGLDADHVARALGGELGPEDRAIFDAHLGACGPCTRAASALSTARRVWRGAIDRDDAFALHAREARLTSAARVPRVRAGRLGMIALGAALGTVAVLAWFAIDPPRRGAPPLPVASVTAPGPAPIRAPAAPSAPALAPEVVITARGCRACARPILAGSALARDDKGIEVAPGGQLVLAWSLREDPDDAASSVEVEGPALVSAKDALGSPAIFVARGVARARVGEAHEVRTELARTSGDHATWRVEALPDRTRVAASSGEVTIEPLGGRRGLVVVRAGEAIDVLRDGRTVPVVRAAATVASSAAPRPSLAANDAELWARSDDALERGDRVAAERALRELLARHGASLLSERASLRLAELELARGRHDDARARLEVLLRAREPSLAADAALLFARSETRARDRAAVWSDYLRTSPPSPYREQASIERARALLDLGDVTAARAIADELAAAPSLPDVARAGLARLRERLGAR